MAAPIVAFIAKQFIGFSRGFGRASARLGKDFHAKGAALGGQIGKEIGNGFLKKYNTISIARKLTRRMEDTWGEIFGKAANEAFRSGGFQSVLSGKRVGKGAGGLYSFGQSLGMYGGSEKSLVGTLSNLNRKMNGLNFGEAGFLNNLFLRSQGKIDIRGSGRNGWATGEELMDRFAEWAQRSDTNAQDREDLAAQLGIDPAMLQAIVAGDYQLLKSRQVLTDAEMKHLAGISRQEKMADLERQRMWARLKYLGGELRYKFVDQWMMPTKSWLYKLMGNAAEFLAGRKTASEEEAREGAEQNKAAIRATFEGRQGGMEGETAKSNRQNAAMSLIDAYSGKDLSKDETKKELATQALQWARSEHGTEAESREAASQIYSSVIGKYSQAANDSAFSSNVDFMKIYDTILKEKVLAQEAYEDKKSQIDEEYAKPEEKGFWASLGDRIFGKKSEAETRENWRKAYAAARNNATLAQAEDKYDPDVLRAVRIQKVAAGPYDTTGLSSYKDMSTGESLAMDEVNRRIVARAESQFKALDATEASMRRDADALKRAASLAPAKEDGGEIRKGKEVAPSVFSLPSVRLPSAGALESGASIPTQGGAVAPAEPPRRDAAPTEVKVEAPATFTFVNNGPGGQETYDIFRSNFEKDYSGFINPLFLRLPISEESIGN